VNFVIKQNITLQEEVAALSTANRQLQERLEELAPNKANKAIDDVSTLIRALRQVRQKRVATTGERERERERWEKEERSATFLFYFSFLTCHLHNRSDKEALQKKLSDIMYEWGDRETHIITLQAKVGQENI
jgi:hypothetical protein